MAISDLEIRNAWEDSLAAGFTPEQIYQGAAANFGISREQVNRALENTANQEVQSLFQPRTITTSTGQTYNYDDVVNLINSRYAEGKTPALAVKSALQLGFPEDVIRTLPGVDAAAFEEGKRLIQSGAFAEQATGTIADIQKAAPVGSAQYNARIAAGLDAFGFPPEEVAKLTAQGLYGPGKKYDPGTSGNPVSNAIQQASSFLSSPENLGMAEAAATMQQVTLPDGRILNVYPDGTAQEFTSDGRVKVYNQAGDVILNQTQQEYAQPGYLTPVVNALMAAAAGAVLGPAGAGLLSTPLAAAAGSGATSLARGGSAQNALLSAFLSGLGAYGFENLFPTDSLTAGKTAVDLARAGGTVDSITNTLVNSGVPASTARSIAAEALAGSSASQIASDFAGLTLGNAAAGATTGAASSGATNLVNVLGSPLSTTAGTGLLSTLGGTALGTGLGSTLGTQTGTGTVNITGQTGTTTGTGTGGTTLGSIIGAGTGTGSGTNNQTVNVTNTNATTAGTTLGSLLGTGALTGLGSLLGNTSTVNVTDSRLNNTEKSVTPVVSPKPIKETVVITETCPAPEMEILLENNLKKLAGDIQLGDKVFTQHEDTLEWGTYPVIYKEIIPNAKRVKVSFDDTEFIGSWDHKFFVSVNNWITIKNLKAGDIVGGKIVKAVEDFDEGPVVFLTIENAHTYVCQGVLSHNKTPPPPTEEVPSVTPVVVSPTTTTGTTTTTTGTNNNNLSLASLLSLLSLFGNLRGSITGGTGTGTNVGTIPPSDTLIGSTTPQFGPDYYAAVQRYYNAYMPETPRNVATPLQQWYENKFGA